MANQKELIELQRAQLAALQRAHILATDAKVKFKLEHDIAEAEERLAALLGKEPPAAPVPKADKVRPGQPASPIQPQRVPTNTKPKTSVPWWLITVVATVITFLLGWWMLTSAKLAALIAVAVGGWLLFRNPELLYQRLALTAIGLVVVLNAINFSGFLDGRVGENAFRLELNEPDIIVSLALLVFAGYMMFLHSRR